MATHAYQPVLVTGINSSESAEIIAAHAHALELFEVDLVSALSPIGHNFVQSFCVFPSGSGEGREGQVAHSLAVDAFCKWLQSTSLDFVALSWRDWSPPALTHSHDV